MTIDKNGQLVTKCICHKGLSGYSSVVARSNFCVGKQDTVTQSLTAYTLDRYLQFKTKALLKPYSQHGYIVTLGFFAFKIQKFIQNNALHLLHGFTECCNYRCMKTTGGVFLS